MKKLAYVDSFPIKAEAPLSLALAWHWLTRPDASVSVLTSSWRQVWLKNFKSELEPTLESEMGLLRGKLGHRNYVCISCAPNTFVLHIFLFLD